MDVSKLISPEIEAEVLREELEVLRQKNAKLEAQMADYDPANSIREKLMDWLDNGEGKVVRDETIAFAKEMEAEREVQIARWQKRFTQLRERHLPMIERFKQLTGADFDVRPYFGGMYDGEDL